MELMEAMDEAEAISRTTTRFGGELEARFVGKLEKTTIRCGGELERMVARFKRGGREFRVRSG